MRTQRVVFVGRRSGALRATRRLGVEVVLIDRPGDAARPLPEGVVARVPWPEEPLEPAAWARLAHSLPEPDRVTAVLGLAEATVVPAARLRASLQLPGFSVATAERCTDKLRMKQAIRAAGLPCARFVACGPETRPAELVEALGLPLVLKPRASSGSRGQQRVREAHELPDPLPARYLAESFVPGVEFSVEALLAGGQIRFENTTEYLVAREANLVPSTLEPEQRARVAELHRAALAALGVGQGMTHTELFAGPRQLVFGELAARPPGGHIMQLIELAYGFDPWEAWLRIHLGEEPELPERARAAAGAWLLHPGAGRVRAVHGLEEARDAPGVVRARLRVGPGDCVPPRLGSGVEVGHLIAVGRDRDEAASRLRAARGLLRIELEPAGEGTPCSALRAQ